MNQLKSKISKRKQIRKLLLINSDIEMQKKIKAKHYVLINSMTPVELENLYQLYKSPVNISIPTYTNILETHMIEKIVDIPNNIEYYCSDLIDNKKEKMKKRFLYQNLYSTKNFIVNYEHLLNDNQEDEEKEEHYHELGENIIPFASKKKSVGEKKIINNKSYPLVSIGQKNIYQSINKNNNNKMNIIIEEELKNSLCECNSDNKTKCDDCNEKKKDKKKILDINNKLIYYCYTHLKRKRPLIAKNSDNTIILDFEIEEEIFTKNKNNQFNSIINKSSKNVKDIGRNTNSVKIKKKDIISLNIKSDKKRNSLRIKNSHNHNVNEQNRNDFDMENEKKMIKRLDKKLQSIRSETNNKRGHIFSQSIVRIKKRTSSIIKRYKSINENKRYIKKASTKNIINKVDSKNSSFDNKSTENLSSLNKNKKRINNIHNNIHLHNKNELINSSNKKKRHNEKTKDKNEKIEKNEKIITRKNFKYLTQHRTNNESEEKMKITEKIKLKKHKKTNDPVKDNMIYFLKKYVEFNQVSDFKENKIKYIKNNHKRSLNKLKTVKCKSNKDCLNYEENLNDENQIFNARIKSNISINKYRKKIKRYETYNLKKTNYK